MAVVNTYNASCQDEVQQPVCRGYEEMPRQLELDNMNSNAPCGTREYVSSRIISLDARVLKPIVHRVSTEYPEGGREAWLVVFGSFCALFLVFGVVNTTAVFQAYLNTHLLPDESPTKIGWIFSVNLFFTFFCGLYVGNVFDRRGPRLLVGVGSFALVASMMLLGLCESMIPPARFSIRELIQTRQITGTSC
jgi:hypothetical protein